MGVKANLQREANILRGKIQIAEGELARNKKHLKKLTDKILQLNLREPSALSDLNHDDLSAMAEERS